MIARIHPKTTYKRGDVILVFYPHSNLVTAKTRPVVIVQADNLQTGLPQLIVAMITSNQTRANHPSRVMIDLHSPEGEQSGLLSQSIVMTDNLATIRENEIERKIGILPLRKVEAALRVTLDL